jgi:hypothetical protein
MGERMSKDQAGYVTEAIEMLGKGYDKAAIIERPRKTHAIGDTGLEEYQLYGWVKMSAKFCAHIKRLRGAKLAIWLCLALNIDENGECKLSQKELSDITGYSHTEVIDSVKELDEMGFLSVDRSGKKNLYTPVFVARGKGNTPSVKKLDSTPADSNESSPSYKNSIPTSIKKELRIKDIAAKTPTPPEVKLYREVVGKYPNRVNYSSVEMIIQSVSKRLGRDAVKDDLLPYFTEWTARGYNPANLSGWTSWAVTGAIPPMGKTAAPKAMDTINQWLQSKVGA